MLKLRYIIINLYALILFVSCGQEINSSQTLVLNTQINLHLQENQSKIFIIVGQQQKYPKSLHIHVNSKYFDPLQVPYITITSDSSYINKCYNAAFQFSGICHIQAKQLTPNRKFYLEIKCATKCDLILQTYFRNNVAVSIGSSIQLNAGQKVDFAQIISTIGKLSANSTGLAIMTIILNMQQNIEQGDQGINLLVNYGNESIKDPSQDNFGLRGESLNGQGKGVIIKNIDLLLFSQINIKTFISLKKGMKIRFSILQLNNNKMIINVGKSYFDYINGKFNQTRKIYQINIIQINNSLLNKTIQIVFDIYSGNPDILISLRQNFTDLINYTKKSSALSVIIQSQYIRRYNGSGKIYIKIQSFDISEYYFYTRYIRQDVSVIQPYFTYFDEISKDELKNYMMIQKFGYEQNDKNMIKNYSFKIDILQGDGNFYMKRCIQLQRQYNISYRNCLIKNESELIDSRQLIQIKSIRSGKLLTIIMNYDINNCSKIKQRQNIYIKCIFILIIKGRQYLQFILLPQRKYYINYLRQNKIIKQYIPKNNYIYYVFSVPSIQNINQINIFYTTFSGDVVLLISNNDTFPTLNSTIKDIKYIFGTKNNIILKQGDFTSQIYISIYAYYFTEINIGILLKRKGINNTINDIILHQGNVQTYHLNINQSTIYFKIINKYSNQIIVNANQITGYISMNITDSQGKYINCSLPSHRLSCKFIADNNSSYRIKIVGNISQQNKFSISYSLSQQCFSSRLNEPIYVNLLSKKKQCYIFNINRLIPLIFDAAFSNFQQFQNQIGIGLHINDQYISNLTSHNKITIQDMKKVCQIDNKNDLLQSCKIKINFINKIIAQNYFYFVMEEQDVDIALFDGINKKIRQQNIQLGNSKNFYYIVKDMKHVQIFFITRSLKSHYFLAFKFVSRIDFLKRSEMGKNIYPSYLRKQDRIKSEKRKNYFYFISQSIGIQRFIISEENIKQYCISLNCFLIISIYPEQFQGRHQNQDDQFEIEVSQRQSSLSIGQSKMGLLKKDEIYTYIIDPEDAIIQFRVLDGSFKSGGICLTASAALANGTIIKTNQFRNDLQLQKMDNIQLIYVKGQSKKCSYEIKYIRNKNSFRIGHIGYPYCINLQKGQIIKFIYYHKNMISFRLIQMSSMGIIKFYVLPIIQNNLTLLGLNELDNYSLFPNFTLNDNQYLIEANNSNFCSQCYYYIIVMGISTFKGEILILRIHDPIILTSNHMIKQWLIPNTQYQQQIFIYYSISSFQFTINLILGKIQFIIINPQGNIIVNNTINKTTKYKIQSIYNQQRIQIYSQRSLYKFKIKGIIQSQFYLEINSNQIYQRIFQGYPVSLYIDKIMHRSIQFINGQNNNKQINIMMDISQTINASYSSINFTITCQQNNKKLIPSSEIIKKIQKSGNIFIISLKSVKGRYFMAISTNISLNATLLLIKPTITYLVPFKNYILNTDGVYEIYTNKSNVLVEIFNCEGQLQIISYQKQILNKVNKSIKYSNELNFYFYEYKNNQSIFYIKINNKIKDEQIKYLIKYYYFIDRNPYYLLNIDRNIGTKIIQQGLQININSIKLIDNLSQIMIQNIRYYGYVSNSKKHLYNGIKCNINKNIIHQISNTSSIVISNQLLSHLKLNSPFTIFISAKALVDIKQIIKNGQKSTIYKYQLTVIYNSIQLDIDDNIEQQQSSQSFNYWITDSILIFIGWVIILLIFVFVIPYYLILRCFRKILSKNHLTQMIEQDDGKRVSEQKIADSKQFPNTDSAQKMIKQHI